MYSCVRLSRGAVNILFGVVELDHLAEIEEGGDLRDARRLLHVVGDDGDGVVVASARRSAPRSSRSDRIERRARLVEQDHLGLHRDGARDAQPLLLAAGQAERRWRSACPSPRPTARRGVSDHSTRSSMLGLRQPLVQPHAEGDVVVDRHRERRRLLEHHADAARSRLRSRSGREDVLAVEHHLAGRRAGRDRGRTSGSARAAASTCRSRRGR